MAHLGAQVGEADRFRAAGCDSYLIKPIKSESAPGSSAEVLASPLGRTPALLVTASSLVKLRAALARRPPAPQAFHPAAGRCWPRTT